VTKPSKFYITTISPFVKPCVLSCLVLQIILTHSEYQRLKFSHLQRQLWAVSESCSKVLDIWDIVISGQWPSLFCHLSASLKFCVCQDFELSEASYPPTSNLAVILTKPPPLSRDHGHATFITLYVTFCILSLAAISSGCNGVSILYYQLIDDCGGGKVAKPTMYTRACHLNQPDVRSDRTLNALFSHRSKTCYITFIAQFFTTPFPPLLLLCCFYLLKELLCTESLGFFGEYLGSSLSGLPLTTSRDRPRRAGGKV